MANAASRPVAPTPTARRSRPKPTGSPFFGLIDAVLVESDVEYHFDGAVPRDDAFAAWQWMARDLAADLVDIEIEGDDKANQAALESILHDLLTRARDGIKLAQNNPEATRRL